MIEALAMGKYGWHVWSSFGLTLAVLIICSWQARRLHKSVLGDIRTRIHAMESEQ